MKGLTYLLLILLLILSGFNLAKSESVNREQPSETPSRFLSAKEACGIADRSFVYFGYQKTPRTSDSATIRLYRRPGTPNNEKFDTTYYIIEYPEGGFALIDARRNAKNHLFAISDKGSFMSDDDEEDNPNLLFYMDHAVELQKGNSNNKSKSNNSKKINQPKLYDIHEHAEYATLEKSYLQGLTESRKKELVNLYNEFSLKLYRNTSTYTKGHTDHPTNMAISPLSLLMDLGMIKNGDSDTANIDITSTIGMPPGLKSQADLNKFNHLILKSTFERDFITIKNAMCIYPIIKFNIFFIKPAKVMYRSNIISPSLPDNQAINGLNRWIENCTDGKIRQQIELSADGAKAFFTNTILLNDIWGETFYKKQVINSDGRKLTCKIYANDHSKFIFLFPGKKSSITDCINYISTPGNFNNLHSLQTKQTRKQKIPTLKLNFKCSYKDIMSESYPSSLYSQGLEFNRIPSGSGSHLNDIFQNIDISISRQGFSAAASTTAYITDSISTAKGDMISYKSDVPEKPFMFMIVDSETGLIMFIGNGNEL